jgi:hypothetical protein
MGILGLPLESLGTNWDLGASPMARHIVYYKAEGADFPQVRAVVSLVSLVSLNSLMARPNTKSASIMH